MSYGWSTKGSQFLALFGHGGHVETIENGVSGILVPCKNGIINDKIYVEKLSLLINNKKIRDDFAKKGYERALNFFTNEKIVQEHIDFIKDNS